MNQQFSQTSTKDVDRSAELMLSHGSIDRVADRLSEVAQSESESDSGSKKSSGS